MSGALTLFSRGLGFSFDLVTRVWDVLMTEGSYKIIYRVSLAMLKVCCTYVVTTVRVEYVVCVMYTSVFLLAVSLQLYQVFYSVL